ncbi:MAG: di-trans,poly-cis-decaprenylcistransferase [Alphaproteobacteria bacterium]|nr:di-trans,poly-cis-decaprenylcistransferase [Alphaproteobacteria bacterium]
MDANVLHPLPANDFPPPAHVAVIMDGNGRWAKARGLPRTAGHKKGADALRGVMQACRDAGVRYLTVYAFSSENWKRPAGEVLDLMQLLKLYIDRETDALYAKGVRLRFIGDRALLAPDVRSMVETAETRTAKNSAFHLTVGLSYGARQELVRAARRLAEAARRGECAPEAISEASFADALDTRDLPDPDLLIRTGGEQRLSNFLLWQSAYTELYFTPVLWPDFTPAHFAHALDEFTRRERRYGNAC